MNADPRAKQPPFPQAEVAVRAVTGAGSLGSAPAETGPRSTIPASASSEAICRHCGNRFTPVAERTSYCCAGCEYVHRLITGQKLDKFYDLRRGATTPVRSVVFQPRDYRWLEGLVKRAESLASGRSADPPGPTGFPQDGPHRAEVRADKKSGGRHFFCPTTESERSAMRPMAAEASLDLDVQGISCVGCVWLIERLWRDHPGTRGLRINATLGRLHLAWTPGLGDVVAFAREVQRFGYLLGPATKVARTESSRLLLRVGLCAAFALNGMLFALPAYLGMGPDFPFARLFTVLSFSFATASVVAGGTHFFLRSWRSLQRGVVHIDLPISLGILVGYAGSIYAWTQAGARFVYFDFVSTFTFLMLAGRWLQLATVERNRHRLLGMQQELPDVELVEERDARSEVASGTRANEDGPDARTRPAGRHAVTTKRAVALVRSDRYVVESGQIVPVSSTLLGPAGSIGMDWISGESEAHAAAPGQIVESGAINLSPHALRLEALEAWPASLLSRLSGQPAPADWRNHVLERAVRVYLYVILLIAAVGGLAWWNATRELTTALQVVVSVLVVSCPCAIGVTLPLIDELAVAQVRRCGVFVRAENLWARMRRVRQVIFDKTGTLTLESLALRNPGVLCQLAPDARAALWNLVRGARHPAASCVREAMLAGGWTEPATGVGTVREEVGFGLESCDDAGRAWRLGRNEWVQAAGSPSGVRRPAGGRGTGGAAQATPPTDAEGDLAFGCDGEVLARFRTAEDVRDDAVDEVARLRGRGLAVFILSGDRQEKVEAMARHLDLPAACAVGAMTPEGKAEWVRARDDEDTLMIGDGANDSLAFAAAACRGTPAIERGLLEHRADFYFLGRHLDGIGSLFATGTRRDRAIRCVLGFAIAYNVASIGLALGGAMNPLLAAVLMPASAVASLAIAAAVMRRH